MAQIQELTCCICGERFEDYSGNNPWPVVDAEGAVCCPACNWTKVIPARLRLARETKETDN